MLYTNNGGDMLIYVDLLFILNVWIDFILLQSVNIILKYDTNYKRIIISSLVGGLSTFILFINNKPLSISLKIIICIIMMLVAFKYKGIKTLFEETLYFYLSSIILAGTFYLIKGNSYDTKINFFLLSFLTPIIMIVYKKQVRKLDTYYKERYDVKLYYKNKIYNFNGYLDTGNNLYDPYKRRPIVLLYTNKIKFNYENGLLIPMETANNESLLKCIKVDMLEIDGKIIKNVLIGLSSKRFKIQDIDMILHKDIIK